MIPFSEWVKDKYDLRPIPGVHFSEHVIIHMQAVREYMDYLYHHVLVSSPAEEKAPILSSLHLKNLKDAGFTAEDIVLLREAGVT
jgi:hypothetical protein